MACSRGCCETQREHYLSISVAPSATPSRKGGADAARINAKEKEWARDMPAYKNLRKNGVQPKSIDGAARLEGATDKLEVEAGALFPTPEIRKQVREGQVRAAEMMADAKALRSES